MNKEKQDYVGTDFFFFEVGSDLRGAMGIQRLMPQREESRSNKNPKEIMSKTQGTVRRLSRIGSFWKGVTFMKTF